MLGLPLIAGAIVGGSAAWIVYRVMLACTKEDH